MKKFKKIIISLFLLVAAVALMFFDTGCTAKTKKIYHERRADKFYDAGQLDKAEIEYLNVLRNAPGDGRTIGRLGLIYFQEGRLEAAAPYLRKGSEVMTNDLDLRLKLGFIYAAMGRLNDARDAANFVLDRRPQDIDAPLLLAQAASTQKEIDAAQARLQKLASTGDHAAIEVALGTLAFRERDVKTADASFKRALALDPKFCQAFAARAAMYAAENDQTNAEINFKLAADHAPDRSPIKVLYARFKMANGDTEAAHQILMEIVKRTPDYVPASMTLAGIALSEKKYDESQGYVDKILARDANNYDALTLDSQLKLAQQNISAATAELERMSRIYAQVPRVHYQLAQAYMAGNDNDKAVTSLSRALDLDPNFTEATLLLAQIQIKNQNPDPAIFALEKLVQKQPELVQAQLLLADAYRQRNRVDDAMAIYASLQRAFPKDPQIPFLVGSAFVQQKDDANARREFNRVLEIVPDNILALEQLVDLDLKEKQFDAAAQRVQSRLQASPDKVELYILASKVFLTENKRDQAEAILLKAVKVDPENVTAHLILAQLYSDSNQNKQALAQLDAALDIDPKNVSALMLKASIYGADKDYKKQADAYEKILEIDPKFSPALNNLAYIYSGNIKQLDRAYDLAQRARALLPADPSTADTLGWICFLRGAYPAALGLLQESAAKMPNEPEIQFHLGMANYMSGNEDAARTAFQRSLQINSGFPESDECKTCLTILAINPKTADATTTAVLQKRLADKPDDLIALGRLAAIHQNNGDSDEAIANYEAILQVAPDNLAALLNLAQLYAPKNIAKAYDMARSAYKLASYSPMAAHIYGRLAYQNRDFKLANSLLQQAAQTQPNDSQALFDLGQSDYSLGKISDAQAALQNALQLNLAAPQSTEAKRLLDLIDLAADPAQAVAATARIGQILKAEPNYVPALMTAGVIDERNNNAPSAEVAYEKILAQYPDFSPAQRELAVLYSKNPQKLAQAYDLASKARTVYPDDMLLAKTMGVIMFQQGDFQHAVSLLNDAAVSLPTDPEIFYYLGAAQFKLKDNAASKASLQQAIALKLSGSMADSAKQMLGQLK